MRRLDMPYNEHSAQPHRLLKVRDLDSLQKGPTFDPTRSLLTDR